MPEDWQNGGFGIYIHWPFCQAKCPYCDFNSHVSRHIDQTAWRQAYLDEIDRYATLLPGRVLNSVFFGGGTPSLMEPHLVGAILERIRKHWPCANDLEVTLEANPSSIEAERFQEFAASGVSRVSIGVQALNDTDLKRLGRLHDLSEALRSIDIARNYFDRVSFDLIYARQDQTLADWETELRQALTLATDHLSLYQLTIEDGTAFGDRYNAGKLRGLPSEDLGADMFQLTQELCQEAGFPAYEISNHARTGSHSRHNLIYWRCGDFIGIGPGAHGRVTMDGLRHATEAWSSPAKWLSAAGRGATEKICRALTHIEQADEYLLMGLRITEGIDPQRYQKLAGHPLSNEKLEEMTELGLISPDRTRIRVTAQGRLLLNSVIKEFLAGS